jgi:arsenite methyltransferase
MGLDAYVARQISRPGGLFAPLVARLLNSGNQALNLSAIDLLELRPGMRVLDVGFGGGVALPELAARVGESGRVSGIDLSPAMVERGRTVYRSLAAAGRVTLELASVESMSWPGDFFDRALTVNTMHYWSDPAAGLREIFRVLRPAGILAVALRGQQALARAHIERFGFRVFDPAEVARLFAEAGFTGTACHEHPDRIRGDAFIAVTHKP